jgi:hypothetical protein
MDHLAALIRRYRIGLGALFVAACGAVIAVGSEPALQAPVESGQVLAGIVTYPPSNPFYVYHVKLWTLLDQGAAVLLKAGVSDISASLWIEGLTAALSFAAIFLIVQAISGRTIVALVTPLFMYYFTFPGIDIAYPIHLLGTSHTYGIFGLFYAVFVVGILGVGSFRTGALLAGLAPAIHPSIGALCVSVTAVSVVLNGKVLKPQLPAMAYSFSVGTVVTGASLLWQRHASAGATGTDPHSTGVYLDAFIRNFDYHRSISGWGHVGLLLGVLVAVSALLFRSRFRHDVSVGTLMVFDALAASVAVAVAGAFLADHLSGFGLLRVLMPWRYMNFANLCLVPVAFGMLAGDVLPAPRLRSMFLLLLLALCLLWRTLSVSGDAYLYLGMILTVLALLIPPSRTLQDLRISDPLIWLPAIMAAVGIVLSILTVAPAIQSLTAEGPDTIADIYRIASERPGMLLTAGDMHLIQLQTRRPVLMDGGALDIFPMVPETGPRFNEILKKVYGLDLFAPPPEEERNKAVISYAHQALWEGWTTKKWEDIRDEFGVTDVLVPSTWDLQLPKITTDEEEKLSLYSIPG